MRFLIPCLLALTLAACDSGTDDGDDTSFDGVVWQYDDEVFVVFNDLRFTNYEDFDDCWNKGEGTLRRLSNGRYQIVGETSADISFSLTRSGDRLIEEYYSGDSEDPYTTNTYTLTSRRESDFTPLCD